MTELLWPVIRSILVTGILLSAMWHPKSRKKHGARMKGDWIDAEYETID